MRTVAILQARMGSARLPGKVLADVCGQPMIARQMARLSLAQTLDEIVVAIPDGRTDDPLADVCLSQGWALYRGHETDVLGRYVGAAEASSALVVVRVTADCPLIDPGVVDDCVRFLWSGPYDFVANNLQPTYPVGLDCQVFGCRTLALAAVHATDPFDREHVVPWMTRQTALRIGNLSQPHDLSHYRLTVDFLEDLTVVRHIYDRFAGRAYFSTAEILDFLDLRPDLMALNAGHRKPALWNRVGSA